MLFYRLPIRLFLSDFSQIQKQRTALDPVTSTFLLNAHQWNVTAIWKWSFLAISINCNKKFPLLNVPFYHEELYKNTIITLFANCDMSFNFLQYDKIWQKKNKYCSSFQWKLHSATASRCITTRADVNLHVFRVTMHADRRVSYFLFFEYPTHSIKYFKV